MTEQAFQLIAVWALLISSLAQTVIHFVTWWSLGPQPPESGIGTALRHREASLAVKGFARFFFDALLVWLVMKGNLPFVVGVRDTIYSGAALTAFIALWLGIRFINALRNDNWGRPLPPTKER